MRRPLAVLTAACIAVAGALLPAVAASAQDEHSIDVNNVAASLSDGTLEVAYGWTVPPTSLSDGGSVELFVNGTSVQYNAVNGGDTDTATYSAPADASTVDVRIDATTCFLESAHEVCRTDSPYSIVVKNSTPVSTPTKPAPAPKPVKQPKGTVSAVALLGKLHVARETHASTYARSKFKLWVDANRDREDTRAEVLKAESKTRVTENSRHTVKTGKWTSAYDGKKFTVASKLDIDHLVPLQEAWTSGAYKWSAKKRTAYANDIGYAASLIAVSKHANRSKGDKEPNAYLPPKTSYRCAYVRNYIAVKSRWGLAVNSGEKAALKADLKQYCATNPWVKKPGKPNLTALAGASKSSGESGGGSTGGGSGSTHGVDKRYSTCKELLKHPNHAPYIRGKDVEYGWYQDRDHDGRVCE